ncbi:MAG: hypothetical protein JKY52_10485 [Flavobacteriales bacterium]|nr:hypothetical protein [Flavobacteriales bacterium]
MKKSTVTVGIVGASICILGSLFRIQGYPDGYQVAVLGILIFNFGFVPMWLINTISQLKDKAESPKHIIGASAVMLLSFGLLFKVLFVPGSDYLLALGVFLLGIRLIMSIRESLREGDKMAILGAFCLLAFSLALLFRIQKYPGGYYFLIAGAISFVILMPVYIIGKYNELVSGNKTNWIVILILGSMFLSLFLPMNISRDFLRKYTHTDLRLIDQASTIYERTEEVYMQIEIRQARDSIISPSKIDAFTVKDKSAALWAYIESLKVDLILRLEAINDREKAKQLLKSGQYDKGDFDKATTMFLLEHKGVSLRRELVILSDFYLSKLPEKKSKLAITIRNLLNTNAPPVQEDEPQHSWESGYFQGIPAVAVIANLSQIQANLRYAEYFVVDDIWKNSQADRIQ